MMTQTRSKSVAMPLLIHGRRGFTTIELMVTIAIATILLGIATPNFAEFIRSTRLTSQINELVADVRLARSEAGVRGVRVVICPSVNGSACTTSANDWPKGRLVFVDKNANDSYDAGEVILKFTDLSDSSSTLVASNFNNIAAIAFNPYGGLQPVGTTGQFKLCSPASTTGRQLTVDASGRPSTLKVSCAS